MNSSRKETERTKFIQEKCQTLLTLMLRDEDNKYCVDCDAKGPRWASWNLGVFLCIRCAGIHRNLGVHISRVKSVNLDSWTPEQVVSLQQMGNSRARAVYEAQMPDGFRRPQTDSALESFIRAKYEQKKYVAREWVQPPPVKVNWDKEIDEEMEKQKRKKKGLSTSSPATSNGKSIDTSKAAASFKSTPLPAPLPKPTNNSSSPKISSRLSLSSQATKTTAENKSNETKSFSSDLLGLTTPTNGSAITSDQKIAPVDISNDVFGCFLSDTSASNGPTNGSPSLPSANNQSSQVTKEKPEQTLAQQEQDFFNQIPNEKEKAKMTKDSILALYGAAPTINRLPPTNQYIPAQGMNIQQQSAFGMPNTGINNFQQFGMMQGQTQQPMNPPQQMPFMGFGDFSMANPSMQQFAQPPIANQNTARVLNPSQMHFGDLSLTNPSIQSFTQPINTNQTSPFNNNGTGAPSNATNTVNQQLGNLNLGNVWQ